MNTPAQAALRQKLLRGKSFRLFLLTQLPSAYFSGLRLTALTEQEATISLQQSWFNKNPFGSVYFAVLQMAAEVSTGVLCMTAIHGAKPAVSMLVTQSGAQFFKKATGKLKFVCTDGAAIQIAVQEAIDSGEGKQVRCISRGYNEAGDLVAECWFEWSFRQRKA
jgi:hypothetical protein